ncbi:hypothetical protein BLA29_005832 [Euroglyphus maynei]|uniref:Uncharacterized protein n=1 Tax=Euroglyphus maynei TaxID=6958 RepID=A0A1Y3BWR0_EURMA|nr:hypothetical protein BLA29_005832 [Euroglyphus maynei]
MNYDGFISCPSYRKKQIPPNSCQRCDPGSHSLLHYTNTKSVSQIVITLLLLLPYTILEWESEFLDE